jgi:hypothetical protein
LPTNTLSRRYYFLSLLFSILVFFLSSLFIGIISNILVVNSNVFGVLLASLFHSLQTEYGLWLVILLLCAVIAIIISFTKKHYSTLQRSLTIANQIISSDDTLLRSLAFLPIAKDYQAEIQRQLTDLLRNTRAIFQGRINRAFILVPDESKTHLTTWVHYGLPQESVKRIRFYIGNDDSRERGVAGEAYCKQQMIITHMIKRGAKWSADQNAFTLSTEKEYPHYRSFVCVPILVPDKDATALEEQSISVLGVVCFDSMNKTIFDNTALQDLLRSIVSHIAAALLVYQRFQTIPSQSSSD